MYVSSLVNQLDMYMYVYACVLPLYLQTLRQYCRMMLEALSYLHSHGIVHNDVRPSLVFLDVGGAIKLGGFAVIKRLNVRSVG